MAALLLQAYRTYNARAVELGRSRGHFLVDLCRPGHMTACLRTFQETIHCNDDNWDAHFGAPADCCTSLPASVPGSDADHSPARHLETWNCMQGASHSA